MLHYFWDRRRWIPLIIYFVLAFSLWANRVTLIYSHLPVLFGTVLYDLIFVSLALLGFVCIFQEIRCPSLTRARVDRAFKQAGLKNGVGEYPTLVSVTEDLNKKYGRRYMIKNMGYLFLIWTVK